MEANSSMNVSETILADGTETEIPKWAYIFVVLFMSAVTLSGVPGNAIIIVVQWKNREKSSTDLLVSTMAAFELLCAGFNSVFVILRSLRVIWVAIASVTICCVHTYTQYITSISSTLLLTTIALDRYFQTCKPLNTFYTKRKAAWLCVIISAASILLSLPGFFISTLDLRRLTCERRVDTSFSYHIIDACLGATFLVMFAVVAFCYTKVAILIQRRHRQRVRLENASAGTSKPLKISTQTFSNSNRILSKKNKVHPQTMDVSLLNVFVVKDVHQSLQRSKDGHPGQDKNKETTSKHPENSNWNFAQEQTKLVNRTTLIMFLITSIYIVSWLFHWFSLAYISTETYEGQVAMFLTKNLYMINCVTNPIFFISLSSKFRKKAKMFFRRN